MEGLINTLNIAVVHVCQLLAIIVISIGIVKSMVIFIKGVMPAVDYSVTFQQCRLHLGYSFSLGLGFLIGASILKTAIAPTWNDIGQLAAIIVIRTLLNYFLLRDIDSHSEIVSRPVIDRGGAQLWSWFGDKAGEKEPEVGDEE